MSPSRRHFIQAASAGALSSALRAKDVEGKKSVGVKSKAKGNPVLAENAREGSMDWQLTRVRIDGGATGYRGAAIEGYASRQSVKAGESIDFHVSTKPA